jgi:hypothetical protein
MGDWRVWSVVGIYCCCVVMQEEQLSCSEMLDSFFSYILKVLVIEYKFYIGIENYLLFIKISLQ